MKKLLLAVWWLSATAALATPIAYEGFNYPLGTGPATNLVGQTTSDGFTWSQAGPSTGGTNVPGIYPNSLTYPGLAPSLGNSVHFGGIDSGGMAARFSLKNSVSSGTLYYSFLLKVLDTNALSTTGVFFLGFNNSAGSQATLPSIVGTRLVAKLVSGGFQLGLDKTSGTVANFQWHPTVFTTNQTIMVVGSYTFNNSSTTDDESDMWINPDASTFGAATAPTTGQLTSISGSDLSGNVINSFCIFNRSAAEPHSMVLDELTIGTTWADVTPTASSMAILNQPHDQSAIVGDSATFAVTTYRAFTYQWQHNNVNIPGATTATYTVSNAQLADAGAYRVVVGNGVVSSNSASANLNVYVDTYPRLTPMWSVAPFSRAYMSTDVSSAPNQRYIAYNALSNQVLVVSRTNTTVNYPTNAAIYVLDADTGNDLYQMNTDPTVIFGGLDVTGGGTNLLTLNALDVADDGAVYASNVGTGSSDPNWLRVYRWDNSGSNAAPSLIYATDPTGLNTLRWGDSLAVRGSGAATQILLDNSTGIWGALITNNAGQWQAAYFTNAAGGVTGGRTLAFNGSDNSFWEKHGGSGLNLVSFDLVGNTSSILTNYPNLPGSPNLVAANPTATLLCAITYASSTNTPDTLSLYDVTDPTQPLLIASYNFPTNHQANANGCGRVIFGGDRVFALDSNNGLVAFALVPRLTLTAAGNNAVLSWPSSFGSFHLTASPSLMAPTSWTNVGPATLVGSQYYVTNAAGANSLFYRLQK